MIALGRSGVAVRSLVQAASPLQMLMVRLTGTPLGAGADEAVPVAAS